MNVTNYILQMIGWKKAILKVYGTFLFASLYVLMLNPYHYNCNSDSGEYGLTPQQPLTVPFIHSSRLQLPLSISLYSLWPWSPNNVMPLDYTPTLLCTQQFFNSHTSKLWGILNCKSQHSPLKNLFWHLSFWITKNAV